MPTYFGYSNVDAIGNITLMAAGAFGDLTGEGWAFYNAVDAPEGAWNYYGSTDKTATITLPASLSAGTWYIFLKMIDYNQHRTIYYTLGAATSNTITTDDTDYNRYWTTKATLTVGTPGSTLVMHLGNNGGSDTSHMFKGLYLTKDANVTVTADDTVVDLNYPSVMDNSTAVKGNLIPNGGFETGVDATWGFVGQGGGRTVPLNTMWDNTQGWEGSGCIKLLCDAATRIDPNNNSEQIISRIFHLKPNKTYTASCYMKASTGTPNASIAVFNTYVPPAGFTGQFSMSSGAVALNSSTWTRLSVSGYAVAYPTPDFQIYISCTSPDGTYLLIDGVQLEEGSLSSFAAAATFEAAVIINQSTKPGNIYYHNDTLQASLVMRNHSAGSLTKTVRFEIYDFMNRLVRQGATTQTVAATTTSTVTTFDISTGSKLGVFRLVTWVEGLDRTEREVIYSIIPARSTGSPDTTSFLGSHPNFNEAVVAANQRLGIKWARALSPEFTGRWSIVEPVDNTFVFYDSRIATLASHNITPMVCLGTNKFWPAWADSSGLPNLPKWKEFCQQMVAHYSPNVKYWEIWNEPDSGDAGFTAAFYAQMLHEATDGILGQDATAKVIAMAGVQVTFMQSVIDQLGIQYPGWDWQSKFVSMATHNYPDGVAPETLTTIIGTYGVPVWNTETGAWCRGFHQGPDCSFAEWGKSIWPHTAASRFYVGCMGAARFLVTNFTRTIAAGQTKYFYYDSRYYTEPSFFGTHPTLWEYDGSMRCKAVAYAIAGSLIDHATTLGDGSADANSKMLVFNGTDPIACIFSSDLAPRQVVPSGLSSSDFEVLDMMGNAFSISGTTIPYGRIPIYVRGIGISAATLKSALNGGTVSTRVDALAPNTVIADGPRGPLLSGSPFRMRWHAIDDTSYPNLGEINPESNAPSDTPNPEAILYQYRLTPYSSWSTPTARNYVDYSSVPDGTYTFEVKATDSASNTSSIAQRSVQVGAASRWLCAR